MGGIVMRIAAIGLLAMIGAFPATPCVADDIEDQRAQIRETAQDTLSRLYEAQPEAKNLVDSAAGYAAFNNVGMKIFFAGGGSGKGLAVNGKTKAETFMKMAEVQAGLGFGVKKFHVVFVFLTEEALDTFIESGWEFGGQATAAASNEQEGGAYQGAASVSPDVCMYQLTDQGLAAEITAKGTKYWKDDDLN
jgi:lipid-binding SYLF domain-containing protein